MDYNGLPYAEVPMPTDIYAPKSPEPSGKPMGPGSGAASQETNPNPGYDQPRNTGVRYPTPGIPGA